MAKVKIKYKSGLYVVESQEILHLLFIVKKCKAIIRYKDPSHSPIELDFEDEDSCLAQSKDAYEQLAKIDKGHY